MRLSEISQRLIASLSLRTDDGGREGDGGRGGREEIGGKVGGRYGKLRGSGEKQEGIVDLRWPTHSPNLTVLTKTEKHPVL